MTVDRSRLEGAVGVATLCAFLLVANQVAAKAVRDALFLSHFDVTLLPRLVMAASAVSIVAALAASRLLGRFGPSRLLPAACAISATVVLGLAAIQPALPRVTAVGIYVHISIFGAVLISWFWSMLNEGLDPSTARRRVGRIAGGGTLGGLLGGLAAERVASMFSTDAMLPLLAAAHAACALLAWQTSSVLDIRHPASAGDPPARSGFQVLAEVRYLRELGALVMVGTVAATLLDFVFKARAAATFDGDELLRAFALFYSATSLATFLLQSTLTRRLLARGVAPTAASLPAIVTLGAAGALIVPGFLAAGIARGLESAVRSSFFRSSYELFYTPVRRADKRAAKTLVDVGFDRLGDAVGGGLVQVVLLGGAALGLGTAAGGLTTVALLVLAGVLGLVGLTLARRLDRGYTRALESSLLDHGAPGAGATATTLRSALESQSAFFPTLTQLELGGEGMDVREGTPPDAIAVADVAAAAAAAPSATPAAPAVDAPPVPEDPVLRHATELRSGNVDRVRAALAAIGEPPSELISILIRLLAWDAVSADVVEVLRRAGDRHVGQLVDALLDPDEEFATRRRLARVLATSSSPRAVRGLLAALGDARFEVRFRAAVALARLHERRPDVEMDPLSVLAAVEREARVNRHVWESNRLLDEIGREESPFYDEILRTRSSRSLEHVFNVLSLVYPPQALRIAYRGLHAEDRTLRGTALEYLEQILPPAVRECLWPFLDDDRDVHGAARGLDDVMDSLLRSHESIQVDLQRLRQREDSR